MLAFPLVVSALLAAQTPAPSAPPGAAQTEFEAVAGEVAFVSDVCYRLATGELRWTPENLSEEIALVEAAGLLYGVPDGVLDTLGHVGAAAVNRATMASRSRDGFHVIMALHGSIPGCRVMLAGDHRPDIADAVAAAIVSSGWTPAEVATSKTEAFERRLFVRTAGATWYRLDFAVAGARPNQPRLLITVSVAVPPRRP